MKTLNLELPDSKVLHIAETRNGIIEVTIEDRIHRMWDRSGKNPIEAIALIPKDRRQLVADVFNTAELVNSNPIAEV